jgi:hypothetical protein
MCHGSNGTFFDHTSSHGAVEVHARIVNAEMRQPKSDRGEILSSGSDFALTLLLRQIGRNSIQILHPRL